MISFRTSMLAVAALSLLVTVAAPTHASVGADLYRPVPKALRSRLRVRLKEYTQCILEKNEVRLPLYLDPRFTYGVQAPMAEPQGDSAEYRADERPFEVLSLRPTNIVPVEGTELAYDVWFDMSKSELGSGSRATTDDRVFVAAVFENGDWYFSPVYMVTLWL